VNLNEWLDNPDRKGIPLPVADAIRAVLAENERLGELAERRRQDRADALSVKSRDGLLSSEWLARTGKAERERDEARAENERLRAATRYRNTHDVRASRIDAALALHHESQTDAVPPDTICFECDCLWPCPTVKALRGELETP
jgi:hypothetical protein